MSSHYERDPGVPPLRIEPLPRRDGAAPHRPVGLPSARPRPAERTAGGEARPDPRTLPHRADPAPVDPGPSYADFLDGVSADDVDTDGASGEAG